VKDSGARLSEEKLDAEMRGKEDARMREGLRISEALGGPRPWIPSLYRLLDGLVHRITGTAYEYLPLQRSETRK
jgi:hypothetical protein